MQNKTTKILGENIKLFRKLRGFTQEKLAELIDINTRQMARIEAGESFITAFTLEKLSKSLNVAVCVLFKN